MLPTWPARWAKHRSDARGDPLAAWTFPKGYAHFSRYFVKIGLAISCRGWRQLATATALVEPVGEYLIQGKDRDDVLARFANEKPLARFVIDKVSGHATRDHSQNAIPFRERA